MGHVKSVVIMAAVIGLSACSSAPTQITPPTNNPAATTSNTIDVRTAKVGDSVSGLRITSIAALFNTSPLSAENVDVKFSGETTVSGKYSNFMDEVSGSNIVCFEPTDLIEQVKLPNLLGQNIPSTFCFSNLEKAKEVFPTKGIQGKATVTIKNFNLKNAPAEVGNTAELVTLISKSSL